MTTGVFLWERPDRAMITKIALSLAVAIVIACIILNPSIVRAFAGLGGYVSELALGTGTSSDLMLGSGTGGPAVLGSAPSVTTLEATNITAEAGGSALLRGNLTNLNGAPTADVWFAWGYSSTSLSNTTAPVAVTTTGEKTATLTGFNTEQTVYYQFRGGTDATGYGSTLSFRIGGGLGGWLLNNLLTLVMACLVIIAVIRTWQTSPIAALILATLGIVGVAVVRSFLDSVL